MKRRIASIVLACVLLCSNPVYADYDLPEQESWAAEESQGAEVSVSDETIAVAEAYEEETDAVTMETAAESEEIYIESAAELSESMDEGSDPTGNTVEETESETIEETETEDVEVESTEEIQLKLNSEGALEAAYFSADEAPDMMAVSSVQSTLQNMIRSSLASGETRCEIASLKLQKTDDSLNLVTSALSGVINSSLDYFYIKSYSYVSLNGVLQRIVYKYKDEYLTASKTLNTELVATHRAQMNAAIADALSYVKPGMSDVEKVLVLHDWLVTHCSYDFTYSVMGYTAYGALVEGSAVCQGYAAAYSGLLSYAGISSYFCPSASMGHAWNLVYLNGAYYHVDTTYDDPTFASVYTYYGQRSSDSSDEGFVSHDHFLKSDTEIRATHRAWDSDRVPAATVSGAFNRYCFYNTKMENCYVDGYWYYITEYPGSTLYKSKIDGSSKSAISVGATCKIDYLHTFDNKVYYSYREKGVYEYNPANGRLSQYWSVSAYPGCVASEFAVRLNQLRVCVLGPGRNEWISITKAPATPTGLSITLLPEKVQYLVGEELDTSGLKLLVTYSDMTTKTITSGYTTNGFSSASVGTKTVVVTYNGMSARYSVTVANSYKDFSKASATLSSASCAYTGKVIKPTVTVTMDGAKLTENTDFIVKYSNNINLGTATVTITGHGNYVGSISKTFTIVPDQVKGLTAAPAGKKKVTLNWNTVYKAEGYYIYRKGTTGAYSYIGMTSALTYTDKNAEDKELNYYLVYAYMKNAAGAKVLSPASSVVSAKGVIPAVTNLRAGNYVGYVRLSWDKQPDAEGYLIYGIHGDQKKGATYGYIGMTTTGCVFNDKRALTTDWNFYWVFPYHKDPTGKMIVGGTPKYVYGKAR